MTLQLVHLVAATNPERGLAVLPSGELAMRPLDTAAVFTVVRPCTAGTAGRVSFQQGSAFLRHSDSFALRMSEPENPNDEPVTFEQQACFTINAAQVCPIEGAIHIQSSSHPSWYLYWNNDEEQRVGMKEVDFARDGDTSQTCFVARVAEEAVNARVRQEAEGVTSPHNPVKDLSKEAAGMTSGAAAPTSGETTTSTSESATGRQSVGSVEQAREEATASQHREQSALPTAGTTKHGAVSSAGSLDNAMSAYALSSITNTGAKTTNTNKAEPASTISDTDDSGLPVGLVAGIIVVVLILLIVLVRYLYVSGTLRRLMIYFEGLRL